MITMPNTSRRMCGRGLSETCPPSAAVVSPPIFAISEWAASWHVVENRKTMYSMKPSTRRSEGIFLSAKTPVGSWPRTACRELRQEHGGRCARSTIRRLRSFSFSLAKQLLQNRHVHGKVCLLAFSDEGKPMLAAPLGRLGRDRKRVAERRPGQPCVQRAGADDVRQFGYALLAHRRIHLRGIHRHEVRGESRGQLLFHEDLHHAIGGAAEFDRGSERRRAYGSGSAILGLTVKHGFHHGFDRLPDGGFERGLFEQIQERCSQHAGRDRFRQALESPRG